VRFLLLAPPCLSRVANLLDTSGLQQPNVILASMVMDALREQNDGESTQEVLVRLLHGVHEKTGPNRVAEGGPVHPSSIVFVNLENNYRPQDLPMGSGGLEDAAGFLSDVDTPTTDRSHDDGEEGRTPRPALTSEVSCFHITSYTCIPLLKSWYSNRRWTGVSSTPTS
jgi:hypothetical protein